MQQLLHTNIFRKNGHGYRLYGPVFGADFRQNMMKTGHDLRHFGSPIKRPRFVSFRVNFRPRNSLNRSRESISFEGVLLKQYSPLSLELLAWRCAIYIF